MRFSFLAAAAMGCVAAPLAAEVTDQDETGFVTLDEAVVEASPKEVWLMLINPGDWWNSAHTWSGDAGNMTLKPQAGGCFCEKIPEVDEPGRFTLEGSVEHMRVIQAYPEVALRMRGGLGPLQSEPVNGILTIAIGKVDEGTKISFEYNVAGRMRYEVPVISKAVDGVMTQQLNGLAEKLGRVDMPEPEPEPEPEVEEAEVLEAVESEGEAPVEDAPEDETPTTSVDEAFGDLTDDDG